MIDTHCHLTSSELFPQWQRVVSDAHRAGVTRLISVACQAAEAQLALEIHARESSVYVAAGIHPHEATRAEPGEVEQLTELWRLQGVVAAGEMGLDFHYDFSPRDVQQQVFEKQLELAHDSDLPIVIHCREAHEEVMRALEKHGYANRSVVFHCFSGSAAEASEIRRHGWRTSFTGLITFRNAAGPRQACRETPVQELLFETDSPYLSPEPVRKMRPNEPQNLAHTIRFAAALLDVPFDRLVAASAENAAAFFRLPI